MPRFFVGRESVSEGSILLVGENAHHLSYSLRGRVGDKVDVCDGTGALYRCTVTAMDGVQVELSIDSELPADTEPPYEAVLCQAIPKGDKMDLIVQKAVELGVSSIIPFESANCVAKIKPEQREKKTARWQRIAEEAAKQCGRGIIPRVCPPCSFEEMLAGCRGKHRYFCYECGGQALSEALSGVGADNDPVYFVIGPEGGFSPSEAERTVAAGFAAVTLGRRILRAETAPLFFLSALSYGFEK